MARLFVIEAPGKKRTFETLLKEAGEDARVQATAGHIFSFPDSLDPVGIDRAFREFERKPSSLKNVEYLRREAMIADEVVVATDADLEGDAIAWDVATLIHDLHPNPKRMRLKGMDRESVREALATMTEVSKADAVPARTRAIIDRLIGAGFSGQGVGVGRIQTALLGLVDATKPVRHRLRLSAPAKDGRRPFTAECDIAGVLTMELARRLEVLDLPALDMKGSRVVQRKPGHMGDIMVRAGDVLDISPARAAEAMQKNYEAGRLSYPRAGSRAFSPTVAAKMAEVLRKAGYGGLQAKNYEKKPETAVHDAPYPIGKIDLQHDPRQLGDVEGVRSVIARDLVRAGQEHVKEEGFAAPLGPFLISKGFAPAVAAFVVSMDWSREMGPRFPGQESWPSSEIVERRADVVLLEKAIEAGLGKPSTWAKHIETFMERNLVDADLRLTRRGREWLAGSPKELLDPRVAIAIEQACERFPGSFMDDPNREPWELNAERIARALPPAIKAVVDRQVAHEAPRPKIDPVEEYGLNRSFAEEASVLARPAYEPTHLD